MSSAASRLPSPLAVTSGVIWTVLLLTMAVWTYQAVDGAAWFLWIMAPPCAVFVPLAVYGWSRAAVFALMLPQTACVAGSWMIARALSGVPADANDAAVLLIVRVMVTAAEWIVLLVTTVVIATLVRVPPGRGGPPSACSRCGYDLTGLTRGVCPECGMWVRMMKS